MIASTSKTTRPDIGDRYLDLIRRFPLRPIRDDEELRRAVAVVDSLIDQDRLDADEEDYLEVLVGLVEKYEDEHHPLPPVSDAAMLRHLENDPSFRRRIEAARQSIRDGRGVRLDAIEG